MSRSITDLHPELIGLYHDWIEQCEFEGIDVLVTCTYRSNFEQEQLYQQGRTNPGPIVTNARAGQSAHNFTINGKPASKAWDFVPLVNGKPHWDAKHPHWKRAGELAESLGLEWAGNWKKFKEFPHIQMKG